MNKLTQFFFWIVVKRICLWVLMGGVALSATVASALGQDIQARTWAASCAGCHGTQGISLGGIPSLAGVDKAQLQQKLIAYKKGSLPATVMHQHTLGYTDEALERLAEFFSLQPR